MDKKVSIIIPARNEEKFIQRAIDKYRNQDYPVEIIVVVNNSQDKTYELAKSKADKVLNFPDKIGVSVARNKGAKVATGEVLIFSDADSYLSSGAVRKIVGITEEETIGTMLGGPDKKSLRGSILFFIKNWAHRLRIYKGVLDGIFFCHRNIFFKTGGFDENKKVGEFQNFIERAQKRGAQYKFLTNCKAFTSLRRYEERGYIRTFFFWVIWFVLFIFKKDEEFKERYFK